jgi:hypothetical protein
MNSGLDFIISLVQYRVEMAMPVARELLAYLYALSADANKPVD